MLAQNFKRLNCLSTDCHKDHPIYSAGAKDYGTQLQTLRDMVFEDFKSRLRLSVSQRWNVSPDSACHHIMCAMGEEHASGFDKCTKTTMVFYWFI